MLQYYSINLSRLERVQSVDRSSSFYILLIPKKIISNSSVSSRRLISNVFDPRMLILLKLITANVSSNNRSGYIFVFRIHQIDSFPFIFTTREQFWITLLLIHCFVNATPILHDENTANMPRITQSNVYREYVSRDRFGCYIWDDWKFEKSGISRK